MLPVTPAATWKSTGRYYMTVRGNGCISHLLTIDITRTIAQRSTGYMTVYLCTGTEIQLAAEPDREHPLYDENQSVRKDKRKRKSDSHKKFHHVHGGIVGLRTRQHLKVTNDRCYHGPNRVPCQVLTNTHPRTQTKGDQRLRHGLLRLIGIDPSKNIKLFRVRVYIILAMHGPRLRSDDRFGGDLVPQDIQRLSRGRTTFQEGRNGSVNAKP